MIDTPLSLHDLTELHNAVAPYFLKKWVAGEENERYKKAEHWTQEELNKLQTQNRIPYSIAMLATKVNAILAMQRNARSEFKVVANSDPADEPKAEVATIQLRQKEKETGFKFIESDVFDLGLAVSCGAVEIVPKMKKGQQHIGIDLLSYKNVVWDTSSEDYEMKDALFIARLTPMYRYQIEQFYDIKVEELPTGIGGWLWDGYYYEKNLYSKTEFDVINLFTHYQRVNRKSYYVVFNDTKELFGGGVQAEKYRTSKEAKERKKYVESIYVVDMSENIEVEYVEVTEEKIDKYVFTATDILEYVELDSEDFPIVVYRSFHSLKDYWTLTDLLKSPQVFLDRTFMQIDHSFGRDIKNVFQGNSNALAEGETMETAKLKAEKTGGIIWTRTSEQAFMPIQSQGVNPQYFQIANIMQSFLEDLSGGRSFQGLQETSQESGRAVLARQQQGKMMASLFLDNLHRWRRKVGKILLNHISEYETEERMIKVLGSEMSEGLKEILKLGELYEDSMTSKNEGFIKINENGLSYLRDADLELVLTEAPLNDDQKNEKFQQLIALTQMYPQMIPVEVLLEYVDLDYSIKQKIINYGKQVQEQQQQMQQQQLNIEKAKVLSQSQPRGNNVNGASQPRRTGT